MLRQSNVPIVMNNRTYGFARTGHPSFFDFSVTPWAGRAEDLARRGEDNYPT
jgi:hypothetical protein